MEAYPKSHVKVALVLVSLLVLVIIAMPARYKPSLSATLVSLAIETPESAVPASQTKTTSPVRWTHIEVKPGDSLARIFQRLKLPTADLQSIIDLGSNVTTLRRILPGQAISFAMTEEGRLLGIRYKKNVFDTLVIDRAEPGFASRWETAKADNMIVFESATITSAKPSLYHAGTDAGLSDGIIMKLSYIFQWDISFALDLRAGDSFSLMYEEIYVDGEKVKEGEILAAIFTNAGKSHEAVRYTDTSGRPDYYTPSGHSMRKAFIRDPVHFSHVSSSFNLKRLHPIHKRVMPHRGIDYAARTGTPVIAAGYGKVTIRRQNNASGKYVVIQHGEQYITKYLHLSAFAKGIGPGKTVKQGETIGYVGSTGWTTAPHLHYEFLVNGVHRNPKTVTLPKAAPILTDELVRFKAAITPTIARLGTFSGKGYASRARADDMAGG